MASGKDQADEAPWGAPRLREALRARYPADAFALLFEVPSDVGMADKSIADAVVMGLHPSRGLELLGFELKASRGDWMAELARPAKAERVCRFCHRWYVVAGAADIVRDGELPPTWGLLVPSGDGLRQKVAAPLLTPDPVSMGFLAAVCRKVANAVPIEEHKRAVAAAREQGFRNGREQGEAQLRDAQKGLERLRGSMRAFEEVSGVRLTDWPQGLKIGSAVHLVMEGGVEGYLEQMRWPMKRIVEAAQRFERAIEDARGVAAELAARHRPPTPAGAEEDHEDGGGGADPASGDGDGEATA